MKEIRWTRRAVEDVQAIRQFIAQDSIHYAELVTQRITVAVERLRVFPESGRIVPELQQPTVREIIHQPLTVLSIGSWKRKSTFSPFTTRRAFSAWTRRLPH